ncbi:MAG: DUF2279 domain-containing protein [Chitinophagaceae bacterium]
METYFCLMKPAPVQNSSPVATLRSGFRPLLISDTKTFPVRYKRALSSSLQRIFFFFSFFIYAVISSAQDITTKDPSITQKLNPSGTEIRKDVPNKKRVWFIAGSNVAAYGSSLIALNSAWYKGYARSSFHTFNDSREWLQMDKIGHAWGAYTGARGSAGMWDWAGLPHKKAVWIGGLSSFAYLTTIEFFDAYSSKWGWSWSDIGANIVGSGLFMSQEFLWNEQRIQFKFSFHTTQYGKPQLEQRANDLFGKPWYERMLKDYNAQTYWFSGNVRSFFPQSNWPSWLNIAIGIGADGMFGGFENKWEDAAGNEITRNDIPRKRQFYLSPDIDFTKIKTKSKFLKATFIFLNAFKSPAPALMMDSKGKFKAYALYF